MPAYLVELPANMSGLTLPQGANKFVVFANSVANAREAAKGWFSGDANEVFTSEASVTEIVAATNMANLEIFCTVTGAAGQATDFVGRATGPSASVGAVAINSGGVATYVVDDILTAAGGTVKAGGRAATFRVTSVNTGVIDGIELVDPGEYEVLPSLTANAVTGGGGTAATMDLTAATPGDYESVMAQMVSLLNAHPDIANAAVDFSEAAGGARLLTLSSVADALGDGSVVFEVRRNGVAQPALASTITDAGIAGAVLSVAIPASPIVFPNVIPLKG